MRNGSVLNSMGLVSFSDPLAAGGAHYTHFNPRALYGGLAPKGLG